MSIPILLPAAAAFAAAFAAACCCCCLCYRQRGVLQCAVPRARSAEVHEEQRIAILLQCRDLAKLAFFCVNDRFTNSPSREPQAVR